MRFKKVLLACFFCFSIFFFPRNIFSDAIKKADKYYEKYDYKYAIEIYEKVMQKKPSLPVAQKLANCYRFINNTEKAETAYARVLTFQDADPLNYKYYAEALKQNGKFDTAKENYLLLGEKSPQHKEEARKLANSCDVARMWSENPDGNVKFENLAFLNSEYSEFSPVKLGNDTYFVSDRWFIEGSKSKKNTVYGWTGNPFLKIYRESSGKIDILPKVINAEYHNGPAVFSPKGDTIYFTRTYLPKTKKKKTVVLGKKTIWMAVKTGSGWSDPRNLSLNPGEEFSVQHPALSADGSILYFASDKSGGLGGMDIYAARRQSNGTWGEPINCGPEINTPEDDVFPVVRSDNKFYFASKGHIGMGGLDVFTAEGSYNTFKAVENLKAPINSSKDDFGIWFNDEVSGYISSNRTGGKGLDDIYTFTIVPNKPVYAVEGEIIDRATGQPLNNIDVVLYNKTTGSKLTGVSDATGKFNFSLEPDMDYVISGDKDKYYSRQEGEVSTKNLKESTVFTVKFRLERSAETYIVSLNNIYYDFNKWYIRKDAANELNKVVSFMQTTPNVNIELRSHTDSRGSANYNQWLSQKRAESAVQYLKGKGVGSERMTAVGLGETELLNKCRDGIKCSAQDHQLNRRTEFKVVKVRNAPLAMAE